MSGGTHTMTCEAVCTDSYVTKDISSPLNKTKTSPRPPTVLRDIFAIPRNSFMFTTAYRDTEAERGRVFQMLKGIDVLDFADISQTALAVGGLYEVAQRAVYTLCAVAYAMDLQMTGFNWQDAMELGNDIATRLGLPQLD
ncbi:MAG: hypothetical protein UY95_C0010G0007 [Parcubacteria group bacterium GW2011_GWA2_56_7]|nr:MAG: hypothetical protein UY95_C0010G0007 [Parcubacteria group bacterium GW2011_GWA2_56_7]